MGLKDRLDGRKRPTATYLLRIDDPTTANADLAAARDEDIATAQAAVDACYERLVITALPPVEMEALLQQHPPTEEQRNNDERLFNSITFIPALFAACIDSDVTEEDWTQYVTMGSMSIGEVRDLFDTVWTLNYRSPSEAIPKELTLTPS